MTIMLVITALVAAGSAAAAGLIASTQNSADADRALAGLSLSSTDAQA